MNSKQLEYIVLIAQERNLMKAAEKCFITQPALSHFITKTEQELGYQIFFRERNNWQLTPAGAILAEGAEKMLAIQRETELRVNECLNRPTSQIRIGVGADRASQLLRRAAPVFQKQFPETRLMIFERRSLQLREMLKNGELDLILCAWDQKQYPLEEILFSIPEPIMLAAAKGHKLPATYQKTTDHFPTVRLCELTAEPFIFHSKSTSIRRSVEYLIRTAEFTPHIVMELESSISILNYVTGGVGLAFLQNVYSRQYQDQADFYYVDPSIDIRFCIARKRNTVLSAAAKALVEILRDLLQAPAPPLA